MSVLVMALDRKAPILITVPLGPANLSFIAAPELWGIPRVSIVIKLYPAKEVRISRIAPAGFVTEDSHVSI